MSRKLPSSSKQLQKTQEADYYKVSFLGAWQLLIQSIAIKFSEAATVVHTLLEFLSGSNNPLAHNVITEVAISSRLLDEANGGEEPDGDASEKKDDKPKDRGHDDCENTFENTYSGRGFLWVLLTVLAKLVLQFDELTSDSTVSNMFRAEFVTATSTIHENFSKDTKAAYTRILGAQEAKAAERKDA
ncbi:hypothetical protein PILCRDRAFT_4846 [Piloderma croceum F 1598]|uniref:Uncharacterized protein n=1 Tax=Piloderma croceum (strain F 1598) TaxID=765440 RepID=A0A0C3BJ41_PILCF|nr:hypothetical protein PILCRDRAFT_4846 [Piloderma croceum F 1598]